MNSLASAFAAKGFSSVSSVQETVPQAEPAPKRQTVSRETVRDGGDTVLVYPNSRGARWNAEAGLITKGHQVQMNGVVEWVNFVFAGGKESLLGTRLTGTWKIDRLTLDDGSVFHEVAVTLKRPHHEPTVEISVGKNEQSPQDIKLVCGGFISVKEV
jgi:hypothetical protein